MKTLKLNVSLWWLTLVEFVLFFTILSTVDSVRELRKQGYAVWAVLRGPLVTAIIFSAGMYFSNRARALKQ